MLRTVSRLTPALVSLIALCLIAVGVSGQVFVGTPAPPQFAAQGQPSTKNGEWPHYNADLKGTRYSPLDQINASNFNKLEVAWRFKTDNFGPFPEYKLEGTPLMVKGVLYTTAGTRRSVIALDAKTGELIWSHSLREGQARRRRPAAVVGPRRLVLDRRQRRRARPLRHDGLSPRRAERQDRRPDHVVRHQRHRRPEGRRGQGRTDQQIDLETGEIGVHSTPTVVGDMVIVGSAMREGATVETHNNTKGLVRAFDVRTGKQLWQFNTIPATRRVRQRDVGERLVGRPTATWASGRRSPWTKSSAWSTCRWRRRRRTIYGGHRPGNNLFAESLVCVDLKTGQRKWHFQLVHHPLWNYDMPAAPILADINVDGRAIKAVAQLDQAGVGLRLRPRDRPAGLADRGAARAAVGRAGREDVADAAAPDQAAGLRPQVHQGARRLDRLHARAAGAGARRISSATSARRRRSIRRCWATSTACSAPSAPATATNWPGGGYDPETQIVYAPAGNTFGVRDRSSRRRLDSRTSATSRASQGGRSWRSWGLATAAPPMRASRPARTSRKRRASDPPAARRRAAAACRRRRSA